MVFSGKGQTLRRSFLAVILIAISTPTEAGLFGSWFKKSDNDDSPAGGATPADDQVPNDIFAQQAKNAVQEVAKNIGGTVEHTTNSTAEAHDLPITEDSNTAKEDVRDARDPGMGDRVESTDRQADKSTSDTLPSDRAVPHLDMNEVIGNSEHLETEKNYKPLTDSEATDLIRNEIESSDMPIGPASLQRDLGDNTNLDSETHSALKAQVESALASLSGVYSALLRTGGQEVPSVRRRESSQASTGKNPVAVVSRSNEDLSGLKNEAAAGGVGFRALIAEHESQTQTPPLSPPGLSSSSSGNTDGDVASSARDAAPLSLDTLSRPSSAKPAATYKRGPLVPGEDDGFATAVLSAFAGLVFIAAVALMVVGYAHSSRDHEMHDPESPLYPPRGPNFV